MNKKRFCLIVLVIFLTLILITILILSLKSIIYDIKYSKKVDAIMADKFEIEKKWLIDKDKIPYNLSNAEVIEIEQTYINFSPEIRVRRINNGENYTMTVKTNLTSDGLTRDEYEIFITEDGYNSLVKKREGITIHKDRYQLNDNGVMVALDIYKNELSGLAYMEIEFESEKEAAKYKEPDWVIRNVTDDVRYKNGHLARYGIPEEGN